MGRLGRIEPKNFDHVSKYPFSAAKIATPTVVEKTYCLPFWHKSHDQGKTSSCVGHGWAMERGITNTRQNVLAKLPVPRTRRYNPIEIWEAAKVLDDLPDTNPGDDNGTTVHGAAGALLFQGAQRVKGMTLVNGIPTPKFPKSDPLGKLIDPSDGISSVRWAVNVDEMRAAIDSAGPCVIGINWYTNLDSPRVKGSEYWIGEGDLGTIRGGHCVCIYGASDKRQAFRMKNSWAGYPEPWIPYTTMQRLIDESGESALVTDK